MYYFGILLSVAEALFRDTCGFHVKACCNAQLTMTSLPPPPPECLIPKLFLNTGRREIDIVGFCRLLRDCRLLDNKLTLVTADVIFTQVRRRACVCRRRACGCRHRACDAASSPVALGLTRCVLWAVWLSAVLVRCVLWGMCGHCFARAQGV